MTAPEKVHAPLAAPTYLTHVTVPIFRRTRALSIAAAVHLFAATIVILVLHHRFPAVPPDEATVSLVIEPSPYVGSGPTTITPVTPPRPQLQIKPTQIPQTAASPAHSTKTSRELAKLGPSTDLPLPAPPAPPVPKPSKFTKPTPQHIPPPHVGNGEPIGYGLVNMTVIPARPDSHANLPPSYPPDALSHGEQGRVLLSIQVAPSGRASAVYIVASSGFTILDNAARDAVLGWHFLPASYSGKRVTSTLLLPVKFEIDTATASVQ